MTFYFSNFLVVCGGVSDDTFFFQKWPKPATRTTPFESSLFCYYLYIREGTIERFTQQQKKKAKGSLEIEKKS